MASEILKKRNMLLGHFASINLAAMLGFNNVQDLTPIDVHPKI